MFITVTPQQRPAPHGLAARIRRMFLDKIRPPEPGISRVEVPGSFFTDIRVPDKGFGQDWQFLSGQSCRFVLCPRGVRLPDGWFPAVKQEEIENMLAHVLCSTAIRIMENSRLPLYARRVGVVDPHCAHPDLLGILLRHVPEVTVFTQDVEAYQGYADRLLEEFGAPATFVGDASALAQTALTILFGESGLPPIRPTPILAIAAPQDGTRNLYIDSPDFSIPELDRAMPPSIDKYAFYTALAERCGIREIRSLCMTDGACGKRRVSPSDIAARIAHGG